MAFFYVSDLHLRDPAEPRARYLVAFLTQHVNSGDIFVLGGDIFDLFVGNKNLFIDKFSEILSALSRAAERGARVYYLQGNHDFQLDGVFPERKNILLLDDDFPIDWEGKRIWVSHGDQINRDDYGYLFLRFITRSLFFRLLLALVPGGAVEKIGAWSSRASRKYTDLSKSPTPKREATKNLFREYASEKISAGSDLVLIGHSHIADQLELRLGGRSGNYFNLGYSETRLPVLLWRDPAADIATQLWQP